MTTSTLSGRALATQHAVRSLTALPDPTFDSAVEFIVGQPLDLRGAASPASGWLTGGDFGGPGNLQYSAYGTTFFDISANQDAKQAWQKMARTFEDIDHEIFSGKFDLLDVNRLRAAQQSVDRQLKMLDTAVAELTSWVGSAETGYSAGNAAVLLRAKLRQFLTTVTAMRDQLTVPTPTIPDTLKGAVDALTEFAQQLPYIWWESNTVFLGAPDDAIQAIHANIRVWLHNNDLLPGSPVQSATATLADNVAYIKSKLAGYRSDAAGDLLPGMDPIAGDLTGSEVWQAASASISKRLNTELDKLDVVAKAQVERLGTAFQAVTDRLMANQAIGHPVMSGRHLMAPISDRQPATESGVLRPTAAPLTPMTPTRSSVPLGGTVQQ